MDKPHFADELRSTGLCLVDHFSQSALKEALECEDLSVVEEARLSVNAEEQTVSRIGEMLPKLTRLRLDDSVLGSIRDLGTRVRQLRILWVSRCGLADLDGISVLAQLEELYASFNDINSLGPLVGHDQLQILDLEGNELSSLVEVRALATCHALTDATLESCPIAGIPLYRKAILRLVSRLESLDGRPVGASDREPLDPAVWRSVQAAAEELQREGKEDGEQHEGGSGMEGRKGGLHRAPSKGRAAESDAGRLAAALDDGDSSSEEGGSGEAGRGGGRAKGAKSEAALEERLMVADALRAGAGGGVTFAASAPSSPAADRLRAAAVRDRLERPVSASRRAGGVRVHRPGSAARAKSAGAGGPGDSRGGLLSGAGGGVTGLGLVDFAAPSAGTVAATDDGTMERQLQLLRDRAQAAGRGPRRGSLRRPASASAAWKQKNSDSKVGALGIRSRQSQELRSPGGALAGGLAAALRSRRNHRRGRGRAASGGAGSARSIPESGSELGSEAGEGGFRPSSGTGSGRVLGARSGPVAAVGSETSTPRSESTFAATEAGSDLVEAGTDVASGGGGILATLDGLLAQDRSARGARSRPQSARVRPRSARGPAGEDPHSLPPRGPYLPASSSSRRQQAEGQGADVGHGSAAELIDRALAASRASTESSRRAAGAGALGPAGAKRGIAASGAPLAKEEATADAQQQAKDLPDAAVMQLLRLRPKEVPQLRSRDAYRRFFTGVSRPRMLRLLRAVAAAHGGDERAQEARIARRMALLDDVLEAGGAEEEGWEQAGDGGE